MSKVGQKRVALKVAILAAGLSQRRVAHVCGIPENRFSEIVCGWLDPTRAEVAAILKAIGKHPNDATELFGENRFEPKPKKQSWWISADRVEFARRTR